MSKSRKNRKRNRVGQGAARKGGAAAARSTAGGATRGSVAQGPRIDRPADDRPRADRPQAAVDPGGAGAVRAGEGVRVERTVVRTPAVSTTTAGARPTAVNVPTKSASGRGGWSPGGRGTAGVRSRSARAAGAALTGARAWWDRAAGRVGEVLGDEGGERAPLAEGFGEGRGMRGPLEAATGRRTAANGQAAGWEAAETATPGTGPGAPEAKPQGTLGAAAGRQTRLGGEGAEAAATRARPRPAAPGTRAQGASGAANAEARPPSTAEAKPQEASGAAAGQSARFGGEGAGAGEDAFDWLYGRVAPGLLRQVELLTGDPARARHAVGAAGELAWQRWPEVARDADPVGWLRAAAYERAFSPWSRWIPEWAPGGFRPQPHPPQGPLEAALLALPPGHRTAVLLHDGLGLGLPATAGEVEATLPAAEARIIAARRALAVAVPDLEPAALPERLGALLDRPAAPSAAEAGRGAEVRRASEHAARQRTLAAYGLTAVIAVATTVAVIVAPTHIARPDPHTYAPAHSPAHHRTAQPTAPAGP